MLQVNDNDMKFRNTKDNCRHVLLLLPHCCIPEHIERERLRETFLLLYLTCVKMLFHQLLLSDGIVVEENSNEADTELTHNKCYRR
jgi:hypothetical protein